MAEVKALKLKRRGAKAKFTRYGNELQLLIDEGRSNREVKDSFIKLQQSYNDVQDTHDTYTLSIEDDDEFEKEEEWMGNCQKIFLHYQVAFHDYSPSTAVATENMVDASLVAGNPGAAVSPSPSSTVTQPSCFKIERPKLPKFSGDVREYTVFKSDFTHIIDSRYGKRDAITILRTCLEGRPLEMIRGIGTDYDAAWDHLDSLYGDPRYVADAIINDLNKFRQLKDHEDSRFCDLVHLVRRCYNTLKEIGRTNDMDNSNMLAMIERKMSVDDRKVWFRFQESTKEPASFQMLLSWMSGEMKTRMRASAPLRSDSRHVTVSHMSQLKDEQPSSDAKFQQRYQQHRCWICKADDHWIDQCKKLINKTAPERLKFIKENHACFSCLKKASRNHHMSTCRRRRQCLEEKNGVRCSYFHHPLLHTEVEIQSSGNTSSNDSSGSPGESSGGNVGVALVESNEALLPLLTVDVIGQQETVKEGNVLLDSGAQISLITDDLASELQLKGVPTNITVKKVGGEKEVLHTHKYKVPIREVNTTGKPILITAVGIPCISEDISAVKLDDLARKFKFRQQDLHRGSGAVDLLVGIDHARLHTGEIREVGGCAARKTPVGWVVFGTMSNDAAHSHTVLHVKLTGSVDLTDSWTEETEGIKSDSYRCEQTGFTSQEAVEDELMDCKKFSSWRKLLRVTAYTFRFIQILKSRIQKGPPPDDEETLSLADLERAEKYWTESAQKSLLPRCEKGDFKVLTPFLDKEGVIRVGGRMEKKDTSDESKHPALLSASHHMSRLITRYMHEQGHLSVSTTTAKVRRRYWILQGHRLAKTVKFRCMTCRAAECKREKHMMANLPSRKPVRILSDNWTQFVGAQWCTRSKWMCRIT